MSENKRKCMVICLLALFIGLMGIVLPEIVFTPKIYINATNITTVGAASTSSTDIFNISEIDEFNYSLVESTTPWYINITFTNITNFTYLETKSMYFATTGAPSQHEVDIEMWCVSEGDFVDLSSLTSHIEWFYFTRNFPDSMHFIDSAGNVTVRFNHSDSGNTNHRLYIDAVRLVTSTQYEQVNINQTIIQGGGTGSQNLSQVLTQGNNAGNQSINHLSRLDMNITNGTYSTFTMLGSASTPFFTAYENGTMRHEIALGGTQIWRLRGADSAPAEVGYIVYSTPASNPGIAIFNSSLLNRIDIASTNAGFEFYVYPNASSVRPSTPALIINRTQHIVIPSLAGAGNAYQCLDSNGAAFRGSPGC